MANVILTERAELRSAIVHGLVGQLDVRRMSMDLGGRVVGQDALVVQTAALSMHRRVLLSVCFERAVAIC